MIRTAGRRKQYHLSGKPSGDKLKTGILFIEDMGKLCPVGQFPKGVYHFTSHGEMNRHTEDCIVDAMKRLREKRREHA